MAAKMEKTKWPGIYRRGSRVVVVWEHYGRQHKQSFRTMAEARETQGKRRQHGEKRPPTLQSFEQYAREWLDTYTGRTKRGRPGDLTETDYRRSVDRAIKFFGSRRRLADVEAPDVRAYVRELEGEGMAPSSVRKRLAPLRAMFATAVEDAAIPRDPTRGVRVTGRREGSGREHATTRKVKALTRAELSRFLAEVPEGERPFFELLAHGGLRISEQLGLDCGDVLFGERPRLSVTRQHCKGETRGLKTEDSERKLPLSPGMARRLWVLAAGRPKDAPLFANTSGGRLSESNLRSRVLDPARERAGLPWVTFHSFRHTCASLQLEAGRNVVQVSKWLGHADVQTTHQTYLHLMDDGLGDAAFLDEAVVVASASARPAARVKAS
jgi:integrase